MIDYIIMDLDEEGAFLELNTDSMKFMNSAVFKVRLRRYIDNNGIDGEMIRFKKDLTYPDFKKIAKLMEKDSTKRKYKFYMSNYLEDFIKKREIYIKERAGVGMAIKNQNADVYSEFSTYRQIVDMQMVRELREKQAWDSFFMCVMKKSANFSVPGSGKTSSALGVFSYLEYKDMVDKIIMIGPKNSFSSWEDEFVKCFGNKKKLNLFNIQDYNSLNDKKRAILLETGGKNLLLFNYESLVSLKDEVKSIIDSKTLLIYDEVHKVKNVQGVRAASALAIAENAEYIITMTGTPIPNSYLDIKNILMILYKNEYNEYFGFTESQLKNPTSHDIENINGRIQPFFCRTNKKQLGVPDANEDIVIKFMASKEENKIFNILLLKYRNNILALIIRILQLSSNPKMLLKSIEENFDEYSSVLDINRKVEEIDYVNYSKEIVTLINSIDKTTKFKSCIKKAEELFRQGE